MKEPPALLEASPPGQTGDRSAPWTREELSRVRGRDPRALDQFFEMHFDAIYGLIARLLGHRESAEDVTQDVFYRAFRAIDRLDPDRDPRSWLVTIAMNACRDFWKSASHRAASRSTAAIEEISTLPSESHMDSQDEARRFERERVVQRAILRLEPGLRAALVLREYEGLPHEAVAASLGISHSAARKRYSRALKALATELQGRIE